LNDSPVTSPTVLAMKHSFNATPERVYRAWTDPQLMGEFLCPGEFVAKEVQADPSGGGTYRVVMEQTDGGEFVACGTYRELIPAERIACTWCWEEDDRKRDQQTMLTLGFKPLGDNMTELTLTQEHFRNEAQRSAHASGWAQCFTKLEVVLAQPG